jgi:hypothetical protein
MGKKRSSSKSKGRLSDGGKTMAVKADDVDGSAENIGVVLVSVALPGVTCGDV